MKKQGYLIYTLTFLLAWICLFLMDNDWSEDSIIGFSIVTIYFLILIYYTNKGYIFAKWIISASLMAMCTLFIIDGIEYYFQLSDFLFLIAFTSLAITPHILIGLKVEKRQINTESLDKINFSLMNIQFPTLLDRYKANMIDLLCLIILSFIFTYAKDSYSSNDLLWNIIFLSFLGSYEPLLTTFSCTIGQGAMDIRVRKINNPHKKINLLQAYLRLITKLSLGWISFFSLFFNKNKRAIHDFVSQSIVIEHDVQSSRWTR